MTQIHDKNLSSMEAKILIQKIFPLLKTHEDLTESVKG